MFNFGLTAAEQAQFDIRAMAGSSASSQTFGTAGLPGRCPLRAAWCRTMARIVLLAFVQTGTANAPDGGSTVNLLGSELFALGLLRRRMRK